MINKLIVLADQLDSMGLSKEADLVDQLISTAVRYDNEGVEIMEPEEHQEKVAPSPFKNAEHVRSALADLRVLRDPLVAALQKIVTNIDPASKLHDDFLKHGKATINAFDNMMRSKVARDSSVAWVERKGMDDEDQEQPEAKPAPKSEPRPQFKPSPATAPVSAPPVEYKVRRKA